MHWITIELLRDFYLFECDYDNRKSSLTEFITYFRRHIKFMTKDMKQDLLIIMKHGNYKFESQ